MFAPSIPDHRASRRLLIVEDDTGLREILVEAFETVGWQVVAAATGEEAVALAEHFPLTVALVDLVLPGLYQGIDVASMLRVRRGMGLPIVIVSGREGSAETARAIGASAHVAKPFSLAALIQTVEAAGRG